MDSLHFTRAGQPGPHGRYEGNPPAPLLPPTRQGVELPQGTAPIDSPHQSLPQKNLLRSHLRNPLHAEPEFSEHHLDFAHAVRSLWQSSHWLRKSAENNLANIIYFRARLCDNTAKVEMLQMAIDTYRAILKKQSRTTDVELYAYNQVNLAGALRELAICVEPTQKRERLIEALKCFAIALEIFTPEAFPQRAARAQIGLGLTHFELSQDETLSQDKRDWFFKESLLNLFESKGSGINY